MLSPTSYCPTLRKQPWLTLLVIRDVLRVGRVSVQPQEQLFYYDLRQDTKKQLLPKTPQPGPEPSSPDMLL